MRFLTLITLQIFIAISAFALPTFESLPQRAIDTLETGKNGQKVVIYTNNTWKYIHPSLDERLSAMDIYKNNWDTTQVFAYRSIELRDLPEVTPIKLIENIDDFHCPLQGRVHSKYGPRHGRNHNGVDISLRTGEPIYAAFEGKVRYAQYNRGGFGYLVIIRHSNGLETWHAHLTRINVKRNSYVNAGTVIGFGGSTGRSSGPHLHFEMRYCDQTFDPEHIIDFASGQLKYATFDLEKSFFNIHSRATDQLEDHDDFYDDFGTNNNLNSDDILEHIAKSQKTGLSQGQAVYHTVRSGDSLIKIARRYGVSVSQITRLNKIKMNAVIKIGQRLRVK